MKLGRTLGFSVAAAAGLVIAVWVPSLHLRAVGSSPVPSVVAREAAGGTTPLPAEAPPALLTPAELPPEIGVALHRGDCTGARTILEAAEIPDLDQRLIAGFLAMACNDSGAARSLLAEPAQAHPFDDWRQLLLAEALAEQSLAEAEKALAPLLDGEATSPLTGLAAVRWVQWTRARGDERRLDEALATARRLTVPRELRRELEEATFLAGGRRATEAARFLASEEPVRAAELGADRAIVGTGGIPAWAAALSGTELRRRAQRLLEASRAGEAHEALLAVPATERYRTWTLDAASALARSARGALALKLLDSFSPTTPVERALHDLATGEAALEAMRPRRGRPALAAATRERLRARAVTALERAAEQTSHPPAAETARRVWAARLLEEQRFSEAKPLLADLRRIDARDLTGARAFFDAGFARYSSGSHRAAIELFAALAEIYPDSTDARRGRYWAARAHEALGEPQRAQALFAELASADTHDFYQRHALARLRDRAAVQSSTTEAKTSWPTDPRLRRAEAFLQLGLDELALGELAVSQEGADPRAVAAVRGRALAGRGEHRESIRVLRGVFDAFGTAHQAGIPPEALRLYYPLPYREAIDRAAEAEGLPRHLVYAMIRQESAFDRMAMSHAGARGLLQLMPATGREVAQRLGLPFSPDRLVEPETNVRLGTHYFKRVLAMFGGEIDLALAGYNAGPYRIQQWWRRTPRREIDRFIESLPLEEPRTYVRRINLFRDSYRQLYPAPADS